MRAHHRFVQISPLRFLAVLMALTFATEFGIMFLLRAILPEHTDEWTEASIDALLLVLILAPILWWMTIRPLRGAVVTEQQRAAAIVRGAFHGVITIDEGGSIESVNRMAESIFGYREEELLGRPVTLLMPERYRAAHRAALERRRSTGTSHFTGVIIEVHGLRKDGSEFPLELSMAGWQTGGARGYAGFVRDITDRKRTERELLRLRKAVEASSEIIFLTDSDGIITYVNPAFTKAYGYLAGEVVGLTTARILKSDATPPEEYKVFSRTLRTGQAVRHEFIDKTKDGTLIPVEVSASPILDENGAIAEFLAITTDITERKEREGALRESEERYRALVESIDEIVFAVEMTDDSPGGVVSFVSDRVESAIGHTAQDFRSNPQLWSSLIHPDDSSSVASDTARLFTERIPVTRQYRLRDDRTSSYRWFEDRVVLQNARNALQTSTLFGVARDITERKQLEDQYRQAQKMDAVGRLAGGIAHDFNNLLTSILGFTQLAVEALPEGSPLRMDLAEVYRAGETAVLLTKQMLAFSRKQTLKPVILDLNHVVTGLERMLRPLVGEAVQMVFLLSPELYPVKVDASQIEQVIMNLVVNAKDAMPEGGTVTFETANVRLDKAFTRTHPEVAPGDYVRLAITDTGTGMAAETLGRIFEPFFTTKEIGKGTGLGLATVYGIIKQSGGYVYVDSQLGHGSTFAVLLSRTRGEIASSPVREDTGPLVFGSETILLVEDEAGVRQLAHRVLTQCGYTVLEAFDGDDALLLSDGYAGSIDLMLTDIVMPKMSGPVAVERVRARRPAIKVLYMSGYASSQLAIDASTSFLAKPLTPSALARAVRAALDAPN